MNERKSLSTVLRMFQTRSKFLCLLTVVCSASAALFLTACGGSATDPASGTSVSSGPLTEAQFVKQASAICKKGFEEKDEAVQSTMAKLPNPAGGEWSPADLERLGAQTLPPLKRMTEQLASLQPPAKSEDVAAQVVEKFESAIEEAEAEPLAMAKGNPFQAAEEAAGSHGISGCAG
jgi:hypothetical protein